MSDVAPPVPQGAVDYIRRKKLKVTFDSSDVWPDEHSTIYTSAKVTELDVLSDLKSSVLKALEEGQSWSSWRRDLRPNLAAKGWWGRREVVDQRTGEVGEVDLSPPARLRLIYQMNTRQAYAAGQWERIQATKRVLPYLLRQLGPSVVHRPQHVAWNGVLLPVDHPWIAAHPCPGSEFGCKCRYRQVGRVEYEKLKTDGIPSPGVQEINPDTGLPTGRLVRGRVPVQTEAPKDQPATYTNRRTGVTRRGVVGQPPNLPQAPGRDARRASAGELLVDRLDAADTGIAKAAIRSWTEGPALRQWLDKPVGAVPVAILDDDQVRALGARTKVVELSSDTMAKQRQRHPELTPEDYAAVARVVDEGTAFRDGEKSMLFLLDMEPGYVAVVKSTATGAGLFLTSYRRLSRDAAKRDRTLRQLMR
ncbi:phage minor head protein [Hydrocarboniphaga effusa]|uniref:phage head morphogenesis protein n=1 Tax=Hydrocarboniphaga effusa TaxID=243629 RepID=UPI003BAB7631